MGQMDVCGKTALSLRAGARSQALTYARHISGAPRIPKAVSWLLASVLMGAHLLFAFTSGSSLTTRWSGGDDAPRYAAVAHNLITGRGYSYADKPTAYRAPLYTLLIAGVMRIAPDSWPLLLRTLQFFASILTAGICGVLARRLFGDAAGQIAFLLALAMPTLLFFSSAIVTECLAALLSIAFFLYLEKCLRGSRLLDYALLGLFAGLGALERFNFAALALIGCGLVLLAQGWKKSLIVGAACLVILSPWLIRNAIAFGGLHAVLSTNNGPTAVQGVLEPWGRAQPGETLYIQRIAGWDVGDIETNTPARPEFRDELALNKQAWETTSRLWREYEWKLIPIAASKLGAFWLSLDQVLQTEMLPMRNRLLRWAGVGFYWAILACAGISLWRLRAHEPRFAYALLFVVLAITVIHLPVYMNTRLRVPLFDPLLCTLAAGLLTNTKL